MAPSFCLGQDEEPLPESKPVSLQGSNGRAAQFLGIKTASDKGITVQMVADGPLVGIPWSKLDLKDLEQSHPGIFAAYQKATVDGENTNLNLGSFYDPSVVKKNPNKKRDGFYETTVNGIKFVAQMPLGKPKGVYLIAVGHDGRSDRMIPRGFPNVGHFGPIQKKFGYVLMSYFVDIKQDDPTKIDDFVFVEKRSGEATLKAIRTFADHSGNAGLENMPIVVYGSGKIGAAYAYNFSQWKPDRVIGAVAANGAFYSHSVSAESAKVPVLFIKGQYNDNPKRWKASHSMEEISAKNAELNPNWTQAIEKRGRDDDSRELDYFAQTYLSSIIKERVPDEVSEDGSVELLEMKRSPAYVGNLDSFEFELSENPDESVGDKATWLPGKEIAELWAAFGKGTLAVPEKPAP